MMIPGIMAQRRVAAGGGTLWTPLNMTTVPQIYLDAQDSVVTDVSGACSAISNLGAMGSNGDFSQATAGLRPSILEAELNGKRVLRFDGVDDRMQGASAAQKGLFQNVDSLWVFVVVKKRTDDVTDTNRLIFAASRGDSVGTRFRANMGTGSAGEANKHAVGIVRVDGGASGSLSTANLAAGGYYMAMFKANCVTRSGRIYINGTLVAELTTLVDATGLTSNTASQEPLVIGAFPSQTAGFADMDLSCLVASNTEPSDSDIDKLFGWAAHDRGLTAGLSGGHPYKTVAPTV